MAYYMGIDIGTSGTKTVLFTALGAAASFSRNSNLIIPSLFCVINLPGIPAGNRGAKELVDPGFEEIFLNFS